MRPAYRNHDLQKAAEQIFQRLFDRTNRLIDRAISAPEDLREAANCVRMAWLEVGRLYELCEVDSAGAQSKAQDALSIREYAEALPVDKDSDPFTCRPSEISPRLALSKHIAEISALLILRFEPKREAELRTVPEDYWPDFDKFFGEAAALVLATKPQGSAS